MVNKHIENFIITPQALLRVLLGFLCLMFLSFNGNCQEILTKQDGTRLQISIVEVTGTSIIYQIWEDPDEIIYEIPKSFVISIHFNNHLDKEKSRATPVDTLPYVSWEYWDEAFENNMKFGLTSIGQYTVQIGYERLLKPKWAVDVTFNWHHYFFRVEGPIRDASGFGMDIGLKYFPFKKPYADREKTPQSLLAGSYIKAILTYSNREEIEFSELRNYSVLMGGAQIGYQFHLGERLNIDIFTGGHIYHGNGEKQGINSPFIIPARVNLQETNYIGENNLAFSFGVKVGYFF